MCAPHTSGFGPPPRPPGRPPTLRHSLPLPPGLRGPGAPRGGPRRLTRGAFITEAGSDGNKRALVSPPAAPSSRAARLGRGSDPRRGGRGGQREDETDALHALRRGLPRLPAQRRQAQEAVRQVLHHA